MRLFSTRSRPTNVTGMLHPDLIAWSGIAEATGARPYEDMMILGSPYQRLVAINGKPLTPEQAAAEKQKLEDTTSERKNESPEEKSERIAKYEKDRRRNHLLMEQMVKAFSFKVVGDTKLDGHKVYVLKATPRRDYRPPNMETEALTGMEGNSRSTEPPFNG